jgi:hypothetical protein
MLMFIYELIADLYLKEQGGSIQLSHWTRFLVFACLLKVDAVTGTIERHLALLAATLRANPAMHRRTEALFLAFFANRTTHGNRSPLKDYDRDQGYRGRALNYRRTLARFQTGEVCCRTESPKWGLWVALQRRSPDFSRLFSPGVKEIGLKCGFGAVFPQER